MSIVLREVFLGKSEACAIEKGVRRTEGVISEDQRSGCQKGKLFNDSRLIDILLKPQNDTALSPYSPIALSPLNNKKLDCFAFARNDVKNYIVKALSPYSPIALSPSNNKKLDCFANARNDKSCATHTEKALSPYNPIALSPLNNKKLDCFAHARNDKSYLTHTEKDLFAYSPIRLFTFKKAAFTLAEVMIVVAIIGVVAALVMPSFIQNMSERINSHRQANIAQKITKSVELMVANGDYQGIYNTEQFVDKLSKYLKISKVCDSEHLTDCWPTKKIKTTLGNEYNVENAKTAADLHVGKDNDTPNVGLVLADGASLIMTFNPKASPITMESGFTSSSKDLPIGDKKTQSFAYTSNATDAIDFVMDVNGKSGPNQEPDIKKNEYYDIRSFRAAVFDGCAYIRIPNAGCVRDSGSANWDNAVTLCNNSGAQLPDTATLKLIYNQKNNYSILPKSGTVWTNESDNAYNSAFFINFADGSRGGVTKTLTMKVLCISE